MDTLFLDFFGDYVRYDWCLEATNGVSEIIVPIDWQVAAELTECWVCQMPREAELICADELGFEYEHCAGYRVTVLQDGDPAVLTGSKDGKVDKIDWLF